jgi:SH3-like domain-containing protein
MVAGTLCVATPVIQVAASHFFVGLGAGMAILALPVLTLTPAADLPHRLADWVNGPPSQLHQAVADDAALSRPMRGYRPGDPTPAPEVVPTVGKPGAPPTPIPPAQAVVVQPGSGTSMRTGVIRSGGAAVPVRRAPAVESLDDPRIADGSPVLVSTSASVQVGDQQWREIRGLSGIAGWVPNAQVAVDGQPRLPQLAPPVSATAEPTGNEGERGKVANTEGAGVVLRNSPNDADRRPAGFLDGTAVTVVERAGSDWVHVRADNGQQGWIPARYLAPPT